MKKNFVPIIAHCFFLLFTLLPVLVIGQSASIKTPAELAALKKMIAAVEANPENLRALKHLLMRFAQKTQY